MPSLNNGQESIKDVESEVIGELRLPTASLEGNQTTGLPSLDKTSLASALRAQRRHTDIVGDHSGRQLLTGHHIAAADA